MKIQAFAKHLFAWTCLVAGAASTAVAQNQPASAPSVMTQSPPAAVAARPFKVAVIEIQSAILGTKDGQKATQEFATRFDPRKKELEQKAAEIKDLQDKLQRGGAAMADAAKAELTRTIEQKTKSYNRAMEDANAEFQAEQSKVLDDLGQKMMQVIEKYAQANGYAVVIDVSNPQTPVMYASARPTSPRTSSNCMTRRCPEARPRRPARNPGPRPWLLPPNRPQCQPRRSSREEQVRLTLTGTLALVLAPGLMRAQADPKIGAINIQAAMTGTKEGQKAAGELQAKLLPRKKAIDAKAAAIRELQDKLQRGGAAMSDTAKADLTRQIDERTKNYNRDMEDAQAELSDENRQLIQSMTEKMTKVLDQYAAANGFSVIFDVSNPNTPVLYTSNMIDITREIIAMYDKTYPPTSTSAKPRRARAVQARRDHARA